MVPGHRSPRLEAQTPLQHHMGNHPAPEAGVGGTAILTVQHQPSARPRARQKGLGIFWEDRHTATLDKVRRFGERGALYCAAHQLQLIPLKSQLPSGQVTRQSGPLQFLLPSSEASSPKHWQKQDLRPQRKLAPSHMAILLFPVRNALTLFQSVKREVRLLVCRTANTPALNVKHHSRWGPSHSLYLPQLRGKYFLGKTFQN